MDELITIETNELLKKFDFPYDELPYRDSNDFKIALNWKERLEYCSVFDNPEFKANLIKLPTQSNVQKWLRDNHRLVLTIEFCPHFHFDRSIYSHIIESIKEIDYQVSKNQLHTYEQALEFGIKDCLTFVLFNEC